VQVATVVPVELRLLEVLVVLHMAEHLSEEMKQPEQSRIHTHSVHSLFLEVQEVRVE
jgi:hypothetical protein